MIDRFIYFIKPVGLDGPIKIGCSNSPDKRAIYLTGWSPFPLEVIATAPGNVAVERQMHNHFADIHSHCEWFHPAPRLLRAIKKIKGGMPIEEAINLNDKRGNVLGKTQMRTRLANGTVYGASANPRYPRKPLLYAAPLKGS